MHLTGGQYKGRKIITPKGVKPTLSKVRESVFNVLASYWGNFDSLSFLDMFAGSAIMSLEAHSRGFKVTSIEKNPSSFSVIKSLIQETKTDLMLIKADALKYIKNSENKFDVIYVDPPWDYDYAPIIEAAYNSLKNEGLIVVEYDKKKTNLSYPLNAGVKILPFKEKIYGRCKVDFIKKS